jgi:glycosyltransferase involved in cell wall biosynthesis
MPSLAKKTTVVYNGINTADFRRPRSDKLREQYGWSKDDVIVGSLGNIREAKSYDILLHAAALLKDSLKNYRFVIAGQGKSGLYDRLVKLKNDLGLDGMVHFLGFIDDSADFLANLDLFLLSSTTEGFSIATIQAMATGLPVIATRSGGPQEIITHSENGWLVDPGEPQQIANAIEKLMNNPELSQRLAIAGKQHTISTFDLKSMIGAYEDIYQAYI